MLIESANNNLVYAQMDPLQIVKLYIDGKNFNADTVIETMANVNVIHIENMNAAIFNLLEKLSEDGTFTKSNLKVLSLRQNFIFEYVACAAANFISGIPLLKLELLNCLGEFNIITILRSVDKSFLQVLNLDNVHIEQSQAKTISDLTVNSALVKLSLTRCEFCHDALVIITDAIKRSSVSTLILSHTTFDDAETIVIADCIINSRLTKLSLFAVSFAPNRQYLMLATITQSRVKTLDVRGNVPIFNIFSTINDLMSHESKITKFKFCQNRFSSKKRIAIIDTIQKNDLFEHISFDSRKLTSESLTKMCNLLEGHLRLKSFALDCHLLSDVTLVKIFDSIKKSSIASLDIVECIMNPPCIPHICDLLENYGLEKLRLNFYCTNELIKQILPAIQKSSLIKFSANNLIEMPNQIQNTIEQILQVNRRNLCVRHNVKSARFNVGMN